LARSKELLEHAQRASPGMVDLDDPGAVAGAASKISPGTMA
jgi:hypothetical protein